MARLKVSAIIILALLFVCSCQKPEANSAGHQAVTQALKVAGEPDKTIIKNLAAGSIVVDGDVSDWQAAGIGPLGGLEWKNVYNMPMFEGSGRIKSVRLAYEPDSLLLMLEIEPGVEERFAQRQSTGHIGYLYLDADGSASTGSRRHIKDEYPGWDWRIYIAEGYTIKENTPPEEAKSAAWYIIEKINSYAEEKVDYGTTFNCEYEELAGGNKSSYKDLSYIAFKDKFIEMRFPFELLQIKLPSEIKLIIEDLNAVPNAEAKIQTHLIR